jgi:hypothetical protein
MQTQYLIAQVQFTCRDPTLRREPEMLLGCVDDFGLRGRSMAAVAGDLGILLFGIKDI